MQDIQLTLGGGQMSAGQMPNLEQKDTRTENARKRSAEASQPQ
jgi:hypothetical protein